MNPLRTLRDALGKVSQKLRSTFGSERTSKPARNQGELVWSSMLGGGVAYAWPGGWSQDRIEQVCHYKHWVWVAIRARINYICQLEPEIGFIKSKATQKSFNKSFGMDRRYEKTLHAVKPHEEIEYVDYNHPLKQLIDTPNAWDCAADLWSELNMFWDLTGCGYLWAVPNGMGQPAELWVIPSHWVWPRIERGYGTRYYEVRPFAAGGQQIILPPEEVIYFHDKNPIHKIDGWSPLTAIAEWEDIDEATMTARYWSMQNGTFPWGAIELDGKFHDPEDVDLDRIAAKFAQKYSQTQNAGKPIILPPGAKMTPLVITPDQMLFEKGAEQIRDWVLAGYGVPKEVAGIQDAGSEIAMYGPLRQFITYSINPRLGYMGQVLTRWLGSRYEGQPRIWWPNTVPESPEDLRAKLDLAAKYGWIVPNEGRAMLLDLEPFEHGGDDPMVPAGLMPIPFATGEDLSDLAELMPPSPDKLIQAETDLETQKEEDATKLESGDNGPDPFDHGQAPESTPEEETKRLLTFNDRFGLNGHTKELLPGREMTDKQAGELVSGVVTGLGEVAKAMTMMATAILNREHPVVNVAIPKLDQTPIHVDAPIVRLPDFPPVHFPEQKEVIVNVPKQDTPVINVTFPDIKFPEQKAPIVNVAAAKVEIPPKKKTVKKIKRDKNGLISSIEEE